MMLAARFAGRSAGEKGSRHQFRRSDGKPETLEHTLWHYWNFPPIADRQRCPAMLAIFGEGLVVPALETMRRQRRITKRGVVNHPTANQRREAIFQCEVFVH